MALLQTTGSSFRSTWKETRTGGPTMPALRLGMPSSRLGMAPLRSVMPALFGVVACVLLTMLAGGCQETSRSGMQFQDGSQLPILQQTQGTRSHESRAMKLVIRDAQTLARVPIADVPVNFDKEMLLVVTLGQVMSDQYSVEIESLRRQGNKLVAETVVHQPRSAAPMVMASPYCIAVVPRCDLNVEGFDPHPPARVRSWKQSEPPKNLTGSHKKNK